MKSPEFLEREIRIRQHIHHIGVKADMLNMINMRISKLLSHDEATHDDYTELLDLLRQVKVSNVEIDRISHQLETELISTMKYLESRNEENK